ncbi:pectinesterase inhibitor 11-like [Vitis riparia]|uniref:pectinesterase inhibitor 11-like n=1 Tax=Vitis riparia TaxID=96939 RepID=UPI00155A981F|nr:pectinesterase inhibitor 11-like [Vitis riparia]
MDILWFVYKRNTLLFPSLIANLQASLQVTKRDMEGSFSSHFLAALIIFLSFTSCANLSSAARPAAEKASTEFIRTSCGTTTYPKLCYTSLSAHASVIQTSPKLLADTALAVTLSTARSTSSLMSKMVQSHGLKPREVAAMHDCVEELSDSVDQL